ncbi:hypothetical protein BJY04DRAFT_203565 [Aspergillus karnatakaensis]|uniref:uncharacterized protein n=1 Tax=Aspergillus karnatakaensis TaxID=1810916 RepID=UPI003CCD05A3
MPVTELATLHLKNNLPLDNPTNTHILSQLRSGLQAQAEYTNATTYLLTQIEDPNYIYILGQWDSVAQHVEEWIPSERNKAIMGGLADEVEVVGLEHLELGSLLPAKEEESDEGIPYEAAVVGIGRYFLSPLTKVGFARTFGATKHHLKEFQGPRRITGGWRVDKEVDDDGKEVEKEEFVLFSGWDTVQQHFSFAESNGFKEFGRIKHFMQGAEIKHARWTFTALAQ